jgi:Flp pilus assembly protein TadG
VRTPNKRRARTRGATSVELVIWMVPMWLMLTLSMQLALGSIARITVEYAARVAARSAVVFLARESDSPSSGGDVHEAAAYPMVAVSPAIDGVRVSIGEHLGQARGLGALDAKIAYARRATAVDVTPPRPKWNDPVTAQVYYLFPCQIPLANSLVCHRFEHLPAGDRGRFTGSFPGWYLLLHAKHTLTNQGSPS